MKIKKGRIYTIAADFLHGFDAVPFLINVKDQKEGALQIGDMQAFYNAQETVRKRNAEIVADVNKSRQLFLKYPKIREMVIEILMKYLRKYKEDASLYLLCRHDDDEEEIEVE